MITNSHNNLVNNKRAELILIFPSWHLGGMNSKIQKKLSARQVQSCASHFEKFGVRMHARQPCAFPLTFCRKIKYDQSRFHIPYMKVCDWAGVSSVSRHENSRMFSLKNSSISKDARFVKISVLRQTPPKKSQLHIRHQMKKIFSRRYRAKSIRIYSDHGQDPTHRLIVNRTFVQEYF